MAELGFNLPDCNDIRFQNNPTLTSRDSFNDLAKFFEDYKNGLIRNEAGNTVSQSVLRELTEVENRGNRTLNSGGSWYGIKSRMGQVNWRFLLERKNFVYRDIYDDFRVKIWDLLQRLLRQESIANIIKKNFEWNDRELGLFSFDRASLSLAPKYAYYSFEKRQTYQEDSINISGEGEETKYFLKSDSSEIKLCYEVKLNEPNELGETKLYIDSKKPITEEQLTEINKVGYLSVVSDIKNSFIYQVEKPKLSNAVRIFIDFGCNADTEWNEKIYCGLTGIIISEFFEYMGYATSIIPYIGFKRESNNGEVYRLIAYQAKKFSETLETEKLLLTCSDIAFFRTNFFIFAHLISDYFGNSVKSSIGRNMDREEKQCSIIQKFKNIDKNPDLHYINVADIYSEQDAIYLITYLIFNIDNENKRLNNERFGTQDQILTERQLRQQAQDAINTATT